MSGSNTNYGGTDGTLRVWDVATGRERRRYDGHTGEVYAVAYSPDGTRLVTGGADGTALVWDTRRSP